MLTIRQKTGLIIVKPFCLVINLICRLFSLTLRLEIGVMERRMPQLDAELMNKIEKAIKKSFAELDESIPRA